MHGIAYGSLSEDLYTGKCLHAAGWDSIFLRKDYEGPMNERYKLAVGTAPDSVAATLAQRHRWAKGGVEVLLKGTNQVSE